MKLKSTPIIIMIVVATLAIVGVVVGIPLVQASTSTTTASGPPQVYDGREITTESPIIHDVGPGAFQLTGSSTDFKSDSQHFQVLSKANDQFDIYWEHNTTDIHVLVDTISQGFVAIGWRISLPPVTLGAPVMDGASIVIGQAFSNNNSYLLRNDFGISGNHFPNSWVSKNITVNSQNMTVYGQETVHGLVKQVTESDGKIHTVMEFVNPLTIIDPYNITTLLQGYSPYVNLTIGGSAYFLVSAFTQSDTSAPVTYSNGTQITYPMMQYHGEDRMVISKPVYIQDGSTPYPPDLLNHIIQKYYPPSDFLTILISNIQTDFGNLIADGGLSNAVLPITGMFFFLAFAGVGVLAIVGYSLKKHWNFTSTLIPIIVIGIFVLTVFTFPLPRIIQPVTCIPPDTGNPVCSQVDAQVVIEAHLKPWNFNITVYQNDAQNSSLKNNWVNPDLAYSGDAATLAKNMMNSSNYLTDTSYGGKVIWNFTVYSGQVVHMVLQAQDTEHGFTITDSSGNTYNDLVTGKEIYLTLPQHNPQNVYFQAPTVNAGNKPVVLTYQCIFYCGAGHFSMKGNIIVEPLPSSPAPK